MMKHTSKHPEGIEVEYEDCPDCIDVIHNGYHHCERCGGTGKLSMVGNRKPLQQMLIDAFPELFDNDEELYAEVDEHFVERMRKLFDMHVQATI